MHYFFAFSLISVGTDIETNPAQCTRKPCWIPEGGRIVIAALKEASTELSVVMESPKWKAASIGGCNIVTVVLRAAAWRTASLAYHAAVARAAVA